VEEIRNVFRITEIIYVNYLIHCVTMSQIFFFFINIIMDSYIYLFTYLLQIELRDSQLLGKCSTT
jgi:hypothetical protein